jgi:hypothetical protein
MYYDWEVTVEVALAEPTFTLLLTLGDAVDTDGLTDAGTANCFYSISMMELQAGTTTEEGCSV